MTVAGLMTKVQKLSIQEAVIDALFDTRGDMTNKQRDQLWVGKLSSGKNIRPPYKPSTIARKKKKGQPYDRVTLKDTGAFYDQIVTDVRSSTVVIEDGDKKTGILIKKYSEKIFGLNTKFKTEYVNESLNGAFLKQVKQITGLGSI